MIDVIHLRKCFGNIKAVDDISFTVKEGERFVLLGTSGCGKTTTLKMINRLIEPDEGTIIINGHPSNEQPPEQLRRKIGYVLQNTGLFPHYTIEKNIAVVPNLLKWDKERIQNRTRELLTKFNLDPDVYLPLYPGQLSGGQKQRVGFARALVADPPVLLMDEPLGALDPITRQQMRDEFKSLNELKNKTIILVTHDIPEAFELGDRICVMDNGKIQQTGTPTELLLHPQTDFVKQFFSQNHFLLQLRAYRLSDLTGYFEPLENASGSIITDAHISVLDAIESLTNSGETSLTISSLPENKCYKADINTIMTAVQKKTNSGP